jgi:hypothetical protein
VSAIATPRRVEETRSRPSRTIADRLLAAVPLASLYLWLCILYTFEAWKRVTPWLFTDELETTQISRAIAATGHPARRGEPYPHHSLYTLMLAPVWLIQNVATAYSGVKYLDVIVMTSVIFPTYLLARLVMRRGWALFAATGAAAIPSLAYSSWIVEETLAYPYAALCFFLIAKALIEKSRGWVAGALVASIVAPFVRSEFIMMPIIVVFATFFAAWSSEWGKNRRAKWSVGDYIGFYALAAGLIITVSGYASHRYHPWYSVTTYYKHRIFVLGDWAAGALAIGIGVIPLVFGLAALVRARGEELDRTVRLVRCVIAAGVIGFGLYTAMKAAYLSTVFETRIEERNLIYIAPLLFIGTAFVLERRRVNLIALAAAAAYGFYLVVGTPLTMGVQLYSDALGFSILQQANRYYEWTPSMAQWLLIGILLGGVALLAAATLVPRLSGAVVVVVGAALAVGILAWNVTGEISAASGNVSISRQLEATLHHPFTWVDQIAHGKPTYYLAQGVADKNPEWELEFWNRSIVRVESLDSTLGGPGPSGTPNITADGRVYWSTNPNAPGSVYEYAVEDWPCVDFAGTLAARHFYNGGGTIKEWRLIQLTKPNRLRAECSGLYPDGWSGANDSTYFRFSSKPGWLRIRISRQNWPATPVHVQLASITTQFRTPALGKVFYDKTTELKRRGSEVVWLHTPSLRFGARVVIVKKFVPQLIDPHLGDVRTLGAQVDYRFFTKLPRRVKPHTGG